MLKKILLSCLTATIILPFPLSVNATTTSQTPAILPLSLALTDKPLSSADRNSIKKEIDGLINAMNNNDSKKFLGHYSKKYQRRSSDGSTSSYDDLVQGAEMGLGMMKAFGAKIQPEDIQIANIGDKKAAAQIVYKATLTKDSPLANTPERKKDQQRTMLVTFEKINGRWLIIAQEDITVAESTVATTNTNNNIPATPITKQDRQTFSNFFKRHLDSLNRKDLNGYLATLDPKAPQYGKAKQETAQLFKEYTLKYTIKSVKVISINQQEAVVEMVATVKKISGGGFKDSQMTTTNLLKKSNGQWRLYDTSIDSLTDLQAQK
jgi:hypothetical protein